MNYSKQDQLNHERIKPKPTSIFWNRKPMKPKPKVADEERIKPRDGGDDKSIVTTFTKSKYAKYKNIILGIGHCQVCGTSDNLDAPHHAKSGSGNKDDRYIICICMKCHRTIHNMGFSSIQKTRKELEAIGWNNFLENKDYL